MGLKTVILLLIIASSARGEGCWHTDLRPHADCDKFVQCSNGAAYVMPCAPGTLFDYENQICNHAWAVTCAQPELTTTTTTPNPGYLPNGCPSSFQEHLLLPHEDCSRFYQCVHGNKVELSCAAGTLFDFHLQVCNWPNQVTCYSPTTTTNEPTTTTQRVYTTSTTEQAAEATTEEEEIPTDSPEFVTETPAFTDDPGLVTDNPGSVTDSPDTTSSEEYSSESTEGSKEESSTTEVTTIPDLTTDTVTGESQETTESTIVESSTTTTEIPTTEADKPDFTTDSPENLESNESESAQITENPQPETETSQEDTSDVNEIEESEGENDITTENDLEFTTTEPIPEQVTSDEDISDTTDVNLESEQDFSNESGSAENEVAITTEKEDLTTARPVPEATTPAPICPAGFFGNVANPDDCSSYYLCSNGIAIPLFCAEGYKYNSEEDRCVVATQGPCAISIDSQELTTEGIEENDTEELENSSNEVTSEEISTELVTEGTTAVDSLETTVTISDETDNPNEIIESTTEVEHTKPPSTTEVPTVTENPEYVTDSPEISLEEDDHTAEDNQVTDESFEVIEVTTAKDDFTTVKPIPEPITEAPICPAGFFGNVANPDDCGSYYMCSNGIAIPLFCAEGCKYDSEQNRCVAVTEGPCAISIESQELTTEYYIDEDITTEELENISNEVTSEEKSTELVTEGTTPVDDSLETTEHIPDETDNSSEIFESTTEVDHTRPPTTQAPTTVEVGTTEDSEVTEISSENDNESSEILEGSLEVIEVSTEKEDSTTVRPIPEASTPAPICPAGFFGNVANPDDCGSYYMCSNGIAIPLFCAEGYQYDSVNGACILAEEGPCALVVSIIESTTTETPEITENYTDKESSNESASNEANDSTNLENSNESVTEIIETTIATENYEELTTTDTYEYTTDTERPGTTLNDTSSTTVSEIFDTETTTELTTENTDYLESKENDITEASSKETDEVNDDILDSSIESDNNDIITTERNAEVTICTTNSLDYVPHPDICNSYYMCTAGYAIQLFCTDGSEFNEEKQMCVEVKEGGCTLGTNQENEDDGLDINGNEVPENEGEDEGIENGSLDDGDVAENEGIEDGGPDNGGTVDEGIESGSLDDEEVEENEGLQDGGSQNGGTVDEGIDNEGFADEGQEIEVEKSICEGNTFGSVPHPDVCNSYYMCTGGFAILLHCADGMEFDPVSQQCQLIAEGGCTHEQIRYNAAEYPDVDK